MKRLIVAIGLIAAASAAARAQPSLASRASAGQAADEAMRPLVIPFENVNREVRLYWLSEGSAILLTDDLAALGAQAIMRDDRLRAFERLHVPPVATLSHATVIRLGQLVGATHVVVGSFEQKDAQLTVRARVIRLDTGRMQPEMVERGPLADMFGVYARIARRLVPDSKVSLAQMVEGHPSLPAFEQYIKGMLAETPATQLAYLEDALELWPRFERARLAQWDVHNEQGDHRRALDAVRGVPAGHAQYRLAQFRAAISLINLAEYEEAARTLAELQRSRPDPAVLNNLGIVQLRRPPGAAGGKATSFFSEAAKLDPSDADVYFNLGYAYWVDKDLPAAIYWLREAVRRNPADDEAHYVLGVALGTSGSAAEAAREKELARQLNSTWAEWEAKQSGMNTSPRGLERMKTDIDAPATARLETTLASSEQQEQREQATFHLERARRLVDREQDGDALAELRRAVYLSPYESEAHLLIGRIHLRGGRVADAVNALKISLWSEDTIEARLALAEAYLIAKDEAGARAELAVVLKRDPGNAEAKGLLTRLPPGI